MKKILVIWVLLILSLVIPAWAVHASVYSEMPVVQDAVCWSCHTDYVPVATNPTTTTRIVRGNHPIQDPCLTCHAMVIQQSVNYRYCTVCHFPGGSLGRTNYFSSRHINHSSFSNLVNVRHDIAGVHSAPDQDCNICHADTLTSEHNRNERTDQYGDLVNCNTCHTGSGLAERVSTGESLRILKTQDNQVEWSTMYEAPEGQMINRVRITHALNSLNSFEVYAMINGRWGVVYQRSGTTDTWFDLPYPASRVRTRLNAPYKAPGGMWGGDVPEVEMVAQPETNVRFSSVFNAINDKETACQGCHDLENSQGHPAHTVSLADACASCHGSSLTGEGVRHNEDCRTCHASTDPVVQEAIRLKRDDCFSCHGNAHGVAMLAQVPADIPLDSAFIWSNPDGVEVWLGESWFPDGVIGAAGRVIYSNRISIDLDTLWNRVRGDFLSEGWQVSAEEKQADRFVFGHFAKGSRSCLVWGYRGDYPGSTNGPSGVRLFIAFE